LNGLDEHPDRRGHRLGDQGRIGDRGQLDPPDPARPAFGGRGGVGGVGGGLRGQPRLAAAARAGQRHQPRAGEQRPHGGELRVPAHEAGELDRQVVPHRVERAQRRGSGGRGTEREFEDPRRGQ
jgi:hypothetical protein